VPYDDGKLAEKSKYKTEFHEELDEYEDRRVCLD
jgi:hypothetical protein